MCTKLNLSREKLIVLQQNAYKHVLAIKQSFVMKTSFVLLEKNDEMQAELNKWSALNRFFLDQLYPIGN